jgi:NO-binding membrane sensor protein with MHYT domain
MPGFTPGLPIGCDPGLTAFSVGIAAVLCRAGGAIALLPKREMLGGALARAAINRMHNVGLTGLRRAARIVWDTGYGVGAVVIGIVLSAIAMQVS